MLINIEVIYFKFNSQVEIHFVKSATNVCNVFEVLLRLLLKTDFILIVIVFQFLFIPSHFFHMSLFIGVMVSSLLTGLTYCV